MAYFGRSFGFGSGYGGQTVVVDGGPDLVDGARVLVIFFFYSTKVLVYAYPVVVGEGEKDL